MKNSNKYDTGIDFIIVNFYREEYVKLMVESIHRFTDTDYSIYIINNGKNEGENSGYDKLKKIFQHDETVTILKGVEQDNAVKPEDGAIEKCKIDGRMVSLASKCKTIAQQKAWKVGNREIICSIDYDAVFLNQWFDDIKELLESNFLVTYMRYDLNIYRDQFLVIKRKDVEDNELYPNLDYKDGSGNITLFCESNKKDVHILNDSFSNKDLKNHHVLNLKYGEQLFVNEKPFFYHYSRGGSRDNNLYGDWLNSVTNYLEDNK
jgi:hypothetical protein